MRTGFHSILKAMIKNPKERYVTVDELIKRLEKFRGCNIIYGNVDGIRIDAPKTVVRIEFRTKVGIQYDCRNEASSKSR